MVSEYIKEIGERSPFVKLLGVDLLKLDHGSCQLSMKVKENFRNMYKTVHGGVIYSLAEIGMGVAMNSVLKKEQETVAIEIKINYLKAAQASMLICDAKIIQKGKNIAVLEAEIKEDEILIAKAMGTYSIIKLNEDQLREKMKLHQY